MSLLSAEDYAPLSQLHCIHFPTWSTTIEYEQVTLEINNQKVLTVTLNKFVRCNHEVRVHVQFVHSAKSSWHLIHVPRCVHVKFMRICTGKFLFCTHHNTGTSAVPALSLLKASLLFLMVAAVCHLLFPVLDKVGNLIFTAISPYICMHTGFVVHILILYVHNQLQQ